MLADQSLKERWGKRHPRRCIGFAEQHTVCHYTCTFYEKHTDTTDVQKCMLISIFKCVNICIGVLCTSEVLWFLLTLPNHFLSLLLNG